ncbi:hypothetical protein SeMB42_g04674 [Synchytrium endobioticum]|uniref:Actin maturation protease n=1 Tax=Synchytrium endobioticum TaxID=286115 RepID=A0A507CU35_9FUNG|nr:hypothetical protein SeLEV6574_g05531 [Synchytrium endobioticum]TPX43559.1 hypothetical protein SeMB42_g04674 [Synchytrium endobioticum]
MDRTNEQELIHRLKRSFTRIDSPLQFKWTIYRHNITPEKQIGPTCGLVALRMAGTYLRTPLPPPTITDLLQTAQANQWSFLGEMFSAAHVARLAEMAFGLNADVVDWDEDGAAGAQVLDVLLDGGLVLLAYDPDFNHEPVLKGGASAHWCLINGCAWPTSLSSETTISLTPLPRTQSSPVALLDPFDGLCLLAYHGKSLHQSVWKYKDLFKSSSNLKYAGDIVVKSGRYQINPEGNLDALCRKLVILRHA